MKASPQVAAAVARRGWTVPTEAHNQAARQLQRRFGIQPPTTAVDAAELADLREKADRQDALEAALSIDDGYGLDLGEFDQGDHTITTTRSTEEQ